MTTIQVFDPALCCSTGVCGVDVDQALVSFSADVDWARQNGIRIERFNLAQQPMAFARNDAVNAFLKQNGQEGLPLIFVDGVQVLAGRYPTRAELEVWSGAAPASLFTEQVGALVAIGAAVASNCELCFKYHYELGRKLGISTTDMRRAVDLAQKVKDTPARAMLELAGRCIDKSNQGSVDDEAIQPADALIPCCAPNTETEAITLAGNCCEPKREAASSLSSGCC